MQKTKAARRAAKHEPRLYEQWGMEEPRYVSNAHSLYRGGQRDLLMRYIIAPSDRAHVLYMGFTVLDLLITVGVVAFMLLLGNAFGTALDSCADVLGW